MATKDEINRREQHILEQLLRTGSITVGGIVSEFEVSVTTARRDLEALEQRGRLRRTHGGAISLEPLLYEPFRHVSSYKDEVEKNAEEKTRIALVAAGLIADGDTIALTPGTTTTQISRRIPPDKNITVVTNTVNVAMELSSRSGVNVFVTGGFLHGGWFSLVGQAAVEAMKRIFPDKIFIGANGLHAEYGATAYHPDEAALNSVMARQSKQRIVVVDHSKLGVVATHLFCPTQDINLLITGNGATDEAVAGFIERGIEVRRV